MAAESQGGLWRRASGGAKRGAAPINAAEIVNLLAIPVQEWHFPIQRYMADPARNRMHLPMMLKQMQCLIDDLRHNIHHIIPSSVYGIYLQSS
jgi:hypothetical protein